LGNILEITSNELSLPGLKSAGKLLPKSGIVRPDVCVGDGIIEGCLRIANLFKLLLIGFVDCISFVLTIGGLMESGLCDKVIVCSNVRSDRGGGGGNGGAVGDIIWICGLSSFFRSENVWCCDE
jgi:hypothetical protein